MTLAILPNRSPRLVTLRDMVRACGLPCIVGMQWKPTLANRARCVVFDLSRERCFLIDDAGDKPMQPVAALLIQGHQFTHASRWMYDPMATEARYYRALI